MSSHSSPVGSVLILNADLGPLHWVSLKHAACMLFREVAVVHEAEPDRLFGVYPMPKVLRLLRYVDIKWRRGGRPPWSRAGVLSRDGHRCGYCDGPASTVDHVVPRSRGGANSWTNTVAACLRCNQRKGNRLPDEVGLRLRIQPSTPSWAQLIFRRNDRSPFRDRGRDSAHIRAHDRAPDAGHDRTPEEIRATPVP